MPTPQPNSMSTETSSTDESLQPKSPKEHSPIPLEPDWEELCDWATD
jgi:hypothetical protein